MDFSNLVTPGGSAAFGVGETNVTTTDEESEESDTEDIPQAQNSGCAHIIATYHNGGCSISDVASTLLTEMPQIPICYLNGVLFYGSAITGGVEVSSSDIYFSFENYVF